MVNPLDFWVDQAPHYYISLRITLISGSLDGAMDFLVGEERDEQCVVRHRRLALRVTNR